MRQPGCASLGQQHRAPGGLQIWCGPDSGCTSRRRVLHFGVVAQGVVHYVVPTWGVVPGLLRTLQAGWRMGVQRV
jgi:hypothetical protein